MLVWMDLEMTGLDHTSDVIVEIATIVTDVFLDAVALLLDEVPDVRFVVAGDDRRLSPSGVPYPDRWRLEHRDDDRVTFTGPLDDAELDALMDRATIVTMPSRYESFGLVVVEAMMHQRAVVASAVGGIVELIEDGVTGRVVPVGDSRALASAIGELVTNPAAAAAMGDRARAHFETHLSTTSAADRLESVVERAIELAHVE